MKYDADRSRSIWNFSSTALSKNKSCKSSSIFWFKFQLKIISNNLKNVKWDPPNDFSKALNSSSLLVNVWSKFVFLVFRIMHLNHVKFAIHVYFAYKSIFQIIFIRGYHIIWYKVNIHAASFFLVLIWSVKGQMIQKFDWLWSEL